MRTMDTITDYLGKKFQQNCNQFIVAGASKRGWTTWLTGAVDPRVIAMAPVVMGLSICVNIGRPSES